MNEFQYKTKRF